MVIKQRKGQHWVTRRVTWRLWNFLWLRIRRGYSWAYTILSRMFSIATVVSCHTMSPSLKTSQLPTVEYFLEGEKQPGLPTVLYDGPPWGLVTPLSPFKAWLISSTTSSLKKKVTWLPDSQHWILRALLIKILLFVQCSQACFTALDKIYALNCSSVCEMGKFWLSHWARTHVPSILESLVESQME